MPKPALGWIAASAIVDTFGVAVQHALRTEMKSQALSASASFDAAPRAVGRLDAKPRVLIRSTALTAAVLAVFAFATSLIIPLDYDYWWHLADGRWIVAHHALPSPDVFSFTAAGRAWVDHEWLSEIPMYLLHQAFGPRGPLVLFALCSVAAILFTFATLRHLGLRNASSAGLVVLMICALWLYTGARPQAAGFALAAAEIWLLERWIARRDGSIWALPFLVWLWGNVHGSFAIGLAIAALILAGDYLASWLDWTSAVRLASRARRQLAWAIAASVALLLINPNGLSLLLYPIAKLHDPLASQAISEWMPADLGNPIFWPFALLLATYLLLLFLRRPRLPASDLLLALLFAGAGLASRKYVPFASLSLPVLIGRMLVEPDRGGARSPTFWTRLIDWRKRHRRSHGPPSLTTQAIHLLELAALLGVLVLAVWRVDPMAGVRAQEPVAAVDALGSGGLAGPLFNDYNWGGYLIWRLAPRTPVFIDGRGDMYISGGELRDYLAVIQLHANAEALLDRYRIQTVLFQKDTPLTRFLLATRRWQTVYDDGRVVVLRRGPSLSPALSPPSLGRPSLSPALSPPSLGRPSLSPALSPPILGERGSAIVLSLPSGSAP